MNTPRPRLVIFDVDGTLVDSQDLILAAMQAAFDRLARTDLPAHLAYLDSVATFHERLKRHFFPALFAEAPIKAVDWTVTPRHQHADDGVAGDLVPAVAGVGLWTAVAAVAVAMRRRRVQRSEP